MISIRSMIVATACALMAIAGEVVPAAAMPSATQHMQSQSLVQQARVVCNGYRCWEQRTYRRRPPGVYIGPGGVYIRPAPVPRRYYHNSRSSAHVRWCLRHYRSYDPRSDTYMSYGGHRKRCRSPY